MIEGNLPKRDASTAGLYRLDADLALTPMISGIMISNGLAWSPEGKTMYHADTRGEQG